MNKIDAKTEILADKVRYIIEFFRDDNFRFYSIIKNNMYKKYIYINVSLFKYMLTINIKYVHQIQKIINKNN